MDLETLHRRAVASWTERVKAVRPDQWDQPTPCSEWDVRALVNHLVGEDLWTGPLMRGSTIEEVGNRFDGDLLGDDPSGAALTAADEAVAAVAEMLPTHGTVRLSYGDEQMDEYVRQLASDHLVHGWDLAAATGGDRRIDEELGRELAPWFIEHEEFFRQVGVIGARVGDYDDLQSDLLSRAGRDPNWIKG